MKPTQPNINNSFFAGIYKNVWRETIPQGLTEAEVDFIIEMGGLKEGEKVFDFMCGYGRHTLALARRGMHVTAIDSAAEYIEELRNITIKEQLPVTSIEGDILSFEIDDKLDCAICMGNSIAFFEKRDIVGILNNVSLNLKPGGAIILNSWTIAEIAFRYFKERDWHYEGEYKCVIENQYCLSPSRIEFSQVIISPDGSIENLQGVDYILSLMEIEEILHSTGFKLKNCFSTPRKRKFNLGDTQIYIVGEKL